MTAMATLPALAEQGLSHYIEEAKRFPILSAEEEVELANKWVENEDIDAAHKLVTSHLRLVIKISMNFRGYGLPVTDIISEGNIGLMQAVKRFDPKKGFRLSTYAMWWIKASINEYVLRSWSLVKMGTTAAHKKLFYNLRKVKNNIVGAESRNLLPSEIKQIASDLNVPERDVLEMNDRLYAYDSSMNAQVADDEGSSEYGDFFSDESDNQEVIYAENEELASKQKMLASALKQLNEREQDIITQRKMTDEPVTLDELSRVYEISKERVRQIENRAMEKLQAAILSASIS